MYHGRKDLNMFFHRYTLPGTNISPEKSILKMIFLFPKVGYVNFLEGIFFFEPKKHLPATGTLSSVQWSLSDRHLGSLCEGAKKRRLVGDGPITTYPDMGWKIWNDLVCYLDFQVFASQKKAQPPMFIYFPACYTRLLVIRLGGFKNDWMLWVWRAWNYFTIKRLQDIKVCSVWLRRT